MAFLREYWYAAAWSSELGDEPLARTVLGEPVALYRRRDGTPAALADRCCHRGLPLSLGRVAGDALECGYHGFAFDGSGICIGVRGRRAVPPGARVRSYPLVERWNALWIWMGDPARADAAAIPRLFWLDDPGWAPVAGCLPMKADYRLLVDNLLDFTHVAYLHTRTIAGDEAEARIPVATERLGDSVRVARWMLGIEPPPMFRAAGGFAGKVDRWQIATWTPPSTVALDIGCAEAGTGAPEGDRSRGISIWSTHLITPETEATTQYRWCYARDFKRDDEEVAELLRAGGRRTFSEDVACLEIQQRSMAARPNAASVDINIDNGPMQARRIAEALLRRERAAAA